MSIPLVHAYHKKGCFYAKLLYGMKAGSSTGLRTIIKGEIDILLSTVVHVIICNRRYFLFSIFVICCWSNSCNSCFYCTAVFCFLRTGRCAVTTYKYKNYGGKQ